MAKKQKKADKTKQPLSATVRILIIVGALIAILALAFGVHYVDSRVNVDPPVKDKMGVSLTGEIVCLPHKGDGPHTLECAYGVRDDDDNHYLLIDIRPRHMPETGTRVQIDGVLVPIDEKDDSQPYDIEASIRYARIKELE